MKNVFLTYVLVLFSIFLVQSQTTKKVLFLGNSYTGVNNLPLLVNNIANSTGDILTYDSNTPGGYRLINHASNATTLNKINSNNWDYVVLQAQSQETSFGQAQMQTGLYPYATSLSNAIRANYECSEPMFYMTWGRENGDAGNCAFAPWVCTYEGMDDAIKATYLLMADDNDAKVSPAGAVWRYLRENHPSLDLYTNDGSHPSLTGSYAVACSFYTMIYKKDPTLINWNSTLTTADANIIKTAAKNIVFDNINNWDFTNNQTIADYTEVININEVSFTNTSTNYDTLEWDFGDGNTSTVVNAIHTYISSGDYTVTLTTTKCGKTDIKTKTITISNLSTEEVNLLSFNIYPNPTSKNLTITFNKNINNINITLFDVIGKTITNKSISNKTTINMNLSNLSNGSYFLKIIADNEFYVEKIIKK